MRNEFHTASAGRYRRFSLKRPVIGFFPTLWAWHERARQRHAVAQLDDHLLRDIGLRRADAILESRKPFWRA